SRRHTSFSRDWSSDVCSSDLKRAREPIKMAGLVDDEAARHLAHFIDAVAKLVSTVLDMHDGRGMTNVTTIYIGNARHDIFQICCCPSHHPNCGGLQEATEIQAKNSRLTRKSCSTCLTESRNAKMTTRSLGLIRR